MPLIAGMMLMVGFQLARTVRKLRGWELGLAIGTAILSVFTNIGIGFIGGLLATLVYRKFVLSSKQEA